MYAEVTELVASGDVLATLSYARKYPIVCSYFIPFGNATATKQHRPTASSTTTTTKHTLVQIFARTGHFHGVKFLLQLTTDRGDPIADVEARDTAFRTALHLAAIHDAKLAAVPPEKSSKRCYQVGFVVLFRLFVVRRCALRCPALFAWCDAHGCGFVLDV